MKSLWGISQLVAHDERMRSQTTSAYFLGTGRYSLKFSTTKATRTRTLKRRRHQKEASVLDIPSGCSQFLSRAEEGDQEVKQRDRQKQQGMSFSLRAVILERRAQQEESEAL
jgi:hypothetical protein